MLPSDKETALLSDPSTRAGGGGGGFVEAISKYQYYKTIKKRGKMTTMFAGPHGREASAHGDMRGDVSMVLARDALARGEIGHNAARPHGNIPPGNRQERSKQSEKMDTLRAKIQV